MFGVKISQFFWARPPEDAKLALFDPVIYPIELHVHGLGLLLEELLSCDAYLSGIFHLDGCGPCFHPISERVVQIGTSVWELTKKVPYLASAADAMILRMILHTTSKIPLVVGTKYSGLSGSGGPSLRKLTPLARLLA